MGPYPEVKIHPLNLNFQMLPTCVPNLHFVFTDNILSSYMSPSRKLEVTRKEGGSIEEMLLDQAVDKPVGHFFN